MRRGAERQPEGGARPTARAPAGWARQTCGQSHKPEEQGTLDGEDRGPWLKPGLGPPGFQRPSGPLSQAPPQLYQTLCPCHLRPRCPAGPQDAAPTCVVGPDIPVHPVGVRAPYSRSRAAREVCCVGTAGHRCCRPHSMHVPSRGRHGDSGHTPAQGAIPCGGPWPGRWRPAEGGPPPSLWASSWVLLLHQRSAGPVGGTGLAGPQAQTPTSRALSPPRFRWPLSSDLVPDLVPHCHCQPCHCTSTLHCPRTSPSILRLCPPQGPRAAFRSGG